MSGFIAGGIAGYAALGTGAILGGAAIGGGIGSYLSAGDAADSAAERTERTSDGALPAAGFAPDVQLQP